MRSICDIPLYNYDTLPSTSTTARELAKNTPAPFCVTAEKQSAGRGRQGKSFFSPAGGIYLSIVMELDCESIDAVSVTSRAAIAVLRAIQHTLDIECGIKWVNDIYIKGRKAAGILVEAIDNITAKGKKRVIIGVGVNTSNAEFPGELSSIAYSIPLSPARKEELTAAIVRELFNICTDMSDRSYMHEYRGHSIVLGRQVQFIRNGVTREGIATEINDDGALTVMCEGTPHYLSSGEITLRTI